MKLRARYLEKIAGSFSIIISDILSATATIALSLDASNPATKLENAKL
jgi:hypothetical protein